MHVLINVSVNSGGSFNPGAVNTQMAQMGTSLNMFGGETRQHLSLCPLCSFALTAVVINALFFISIRKKQILYSFMPIRFDLCYDFPAEVYVLYQMNTYHLGLIFIIIQLFRCWWWQSKQNGRVITYVRSVRHVGWSKQSQRRR